MRSHFVRSFVLVLTIAAHLIAQAPDGPPIRVDTVLINVPVIVTDSAGRYIGGLKKDDFAVVIDGEKQEIEYFADTDAPLSVAIVVDISGSTGPFMGRIKDAARSFVDMLNPADRAMLVAFHQDSWVLCPFTSDWSKFKKEVNKLGTASGSPGMGPGSNMYDPVYKLLTKEMRAVKGRKAIIILTDGFVNRTVEAKPFRDSLIEGDTLIYPMMFLTGFTKDLSLRELVYSPPGSWMNALALQTGGRLLITGKNNDFHKAFQSVADELRKQYVIGFYPPKPTSAQKTSHYKSAERTPIPEVRQPYGSNRLTARHERAHSLPVVFCLRLIKH